MSDESIDVLLEEGRTFPPPPEFAAKAVVKDAAVYEQADRDLDGFWLARTAETVGWFQQPSVGLEWDPPHCTWFRDGTLNASHSCLDRHVEAGKGGHIAYYWEGEPEGERCELTFADLQAEVVKLANALKELGVKKGTPVAIYMGMVPELPVAMLACARLGAPHMVVFGGFSACSGPHFMCERIAVGAVYRMSTL